MGTPHHASRGPVAASASVIRMSTMWRRSASGTNTVYSP